ncbi:unnamed protein product [Larinioides sclopetarius]|uniref:C2H2-type domain-containing protein n=1 Tax=Larinioides sclopetarius TaxID=280406 RepID=A0AAV2BE70_9ARAC
MLYMDHLQRQTCNKTFNNNEDQNISWNEKCDIVFSPSKLNEFEKLFLWLDGSADNPYLDTSDDAGDGGPKIQKHKYRESEQSNSQLSEENANITFMNTFNENAQGKSFDTHYNDPQQENPLDGLLLGCLTTADPYASEAKEKIANHSNTSGVSETLYQSHTVDNEKDYTKLSIRDYIETFTSALYTLYEQNVITFNNESSEKCIVTPDVSNRDTFHNNATGLQESLEDIHKENFLYASNIPASKGYSGNFGFTSKSHEEQQNLTLYSLSYPACVPRGNEFTNYYESLPSENNKNHVATGMDVEAQRQPQEKRFICPLCGNSFPRKDYLVAHYRKHTGERPYVCEKCGKGFTTNGILKKHRVSHNEEKPFVCGNCKKGFVRNCDLTRHLRTHTGEKKYECSICGKGFSDCSNRNRHYKNIHGRK